MFSYTSLRAALKETPEFDELTAFQAGGCRT